MAIQRRKVDTAFVEVMGQHKLLEVVKDTASPLIARLLQEKPAWIRKALKSAGYIMMRDIQSGMNSGAPGGQAYPKFFNYKIRRAFESAASHMRTNRKYKPLGKLDRSIKYRYFGEAAGGGKAYVLVGFTSASGVKLGRMMEDGFQRTVTEKMAGAFNEAFKKLGYPTRMRPGKTINVPARKTIGPMRQAMSPWVTQFIESKLEQYMREGGFESKMGTNRSYKIKEAF